MRVPGLLALLAIAAGAACADRGPGPSGKKIDPAYVKAHLLATVPAGIERFDVALGDRVLYIGNKVDKPRVAPGQAVTITHYWYVVRPPGPSWRSFALVRAPAGSADFMNLPLTDMQVG